MIFWLAYFSSPVKPTEVYNRLLYANSSQGLQDFESCFISTLVELPTSTRKWHEYCWVSYLQSVDDQNLQIYYISHPL